MLSTEPPLLGDSMCYFPKFGKGQVAVKDPDIETVEVVGLPYCLTQHSN